MFAVFFPLLKCGQVDDDETPGSSHINRDIWAYPPKNPVVFIE